jgi:hypothetical protein
MGPPSGNKPLPPASKAPQPQGGDMGALAAARNRLARAQGQGYAGMLLTRKGAAGSLSNLNRPNGTPIGGNKLLGN